MLDFTFFRVWCCKAEQKFRFALLISFIINPRLLFLKQKFLKLFLFTFLKEEGIVDGLKLNHRLILQTTALGFMMLASSVTGMSGTSFIPSIAPEVIEIRQTLPNENKKVLIEKNITVEEYIKNYFSDIPLMIEVAKCESRFRQHDKEGEVLRGEQNNLDRGVMQINEFYHNDTSDKLGYDILTLEGNTAYARHLYEKYGVKPWSSSAKCWKKTTAYLEYSEGLKELAVNK